MIIIFDTCTTFSLHLLHNFNVYVFFCAQTRFQKPQTYVKVLSVLILSALHKKAPKKHNIKSSLT